MELGKIKEEGKKNEIFTLLYKGNIAAGFIKDATVNHIRRLGGVGLLVLGMHCAGELDAAAGRDKGAGSPNIYLFR